MPPYNVDGVGTYSAADIATLLGIVQGKEYYITYYDPLTNAERTMQVYTSNSASDCYSGVLYNGM